MNKIPLIAKAIAAGVTAFGGALATALPDGVTATEWVTIAIATAVAASAVWAVPNAGTANGAHEA